MPIESVSRVQTHVRIRAKAYLIQFFHPRFQTECRTFFSSKVTKAVIVKTDVQKRNRLQTTSAGTRSEVQIAAIRN